MKSAVRIVNTFPEFLSWWEKVQSKPLDEQIESWATEYMLLYPELLALQVEDYEAQNLDWRQIARDKVFPDLSKRLTAMEQAHYALCDLCQPIYDRAQQILGFESEVVFAIYVGVGCGAGWVTQYQDLPAILFGVENIAECGWTNPEAISGLIAHEIGHLAHHHWRIRQEKPIGFGAWWQLYEEGFAQVCESLILNVPSWHQASGDSEWLNWCQRHKARLAAKFLQATEGNEPVTSFFGSWYTIDGRSQTGYFLGYEAVRALLKKRRSIKELALIDNIEDCLRPVLASLAENGG